MKMEKQNKNLEELTYEELMLPDVQYSTIAARIGDVELTVLDVIAAAVLSGRSLLIVGHSEKGKSYIARMIRDYWFGGRGHLIQAASLDDTSDLFTQVFKELSKEQASEIVLEEKLAYPFIFVDEVGAVPKALQSQFWPIGDGKIPHKGKEYYLGIPIEEKQNIKRRYLSYIACTNTIRESEDGEYSNFGITKATASRFHLLLDTRRKLRRKEEDIIDIIMSDNVDVRHTETIEKKDITHKIINAHKKIIKLAENTSIEERIVLAYLGIGTGKCKKGEKYEDGWQLKCMDCKEQEDCPNAYLFNYEMLRQVKNIKIFANALYYVASLKSKGVNGQVDPYDAVFEAAKFVIAGKYSTMNELLMREKQLPDYDFVENAIDKLKQEFNKVRPFIEVSIEVAEKYGEVVTQFYEDNNRVYPISERFFEEVGKARGLKGEKLQSYVKEIYNEIQKSNIIEPYNDNGYVSLSWFPKLLERYITKLKQEK